MSIENCKNYKRSFRGLLEYSRCLVSADKDMGCFGYSDFCPIPEKFVPRREVERGTITFGEGLHGG